MTTYLDDYSPDELLIGKNRVICYLDAFRRLDVYSIDQFPHIVARDMGLGRIWRSTRGVQSKDDAPKIEEWVSYVVRSTSGSLVIVRRPLVIADFTGDCEEDCVDTCLGYCGS